MTSGGVHFGFVFRSLSVPNHAVPCQPPNHEGFASVTVPNAAPLRRVRMVRYSLDDVPEFAVPAGFSLRWHETGDVANWLCIWQAAEAYQAITPDRFEREFGRDPACWRERQCFLCDSSGAAVGTATAWFDDDYFGQRFGRVHWVAVRPPFQGRGLAKPLLSATCRRLRELGHDRAYLVTETVRLPAIRLYGKFGFRPDIRGEEDLSHWRDLRQQTPGLDLGTT